MKRYLFALAVGMVFTAFGTAEDKPVTAAPAQTPVVTATPATVVTSGYSTSSTRRGLLGRLRGKNSGTVMTAPVTTATPVPSTTVPAPMPTPKTGASTTPSNPVVVAGGTDTKPTKVVPASGTSTTPAVVVGTPVTTMVDPMMTTTAKRMGVVARLRARR